MLICMYYLSDCIARFRNMVKAIERIKDDAFNPDDYRNNFYAIALDMNTALEECTFGFTPSNTTLFTMSKSIVNQSVQTVQQSESKADFLAALNNIVTPFHEYNFEGFTYWDYKDSVRNSLKNDAATVEPQLLQQIASKIQSRTNRTINILDIKAREARNELIMKDLVPAGSNFYGMGLSERNLSSTRRNFTRIALGTLKGSVVSNEVFDVMIVQSEVSVEKNSERLFFKKERDTIRDTIKYLRPGGWVAILLPYYRFYKDICMSIAKNFDHVQLRKLEGSFFPENGIVAVIGQRCEKANKDLDADAYNLLRHAYRIDQVESINNNEFQEMLLPPTELEIKMFRGSILDEEEINLIYHESNCQAQFWDNQKVDKLSENIKNPLLPFNIGQLGLVLTSGCLDGVISDEDGKVHLVKGRVVKKTDYKRSVEEREVHVTETTSNRVEINVLLPNGVHKILA